MPATWLDELACLGMALCVRYSEMTGTNACEKAPSAKKRRMRFGILNATVNASMTGPEPNQAENAMSRASPVIRDSSVMKPTTEVAVNRRSPWPRGRVARFRSVIGGSCGASYVLDLPRSRSE